MAYDDKEYSVDSGEPYELYDFIRGSWAMYLTSRATELYINDNQIYKPASIKRSKIRQGEELKKDVIQITVPRGHELAAEFLLYPPEDTVSITIRRLHRSLVFDEAVVMWKGRVVGAEPKGEKVEISCESIYTSMRRKGPRLKAELICQHVLYGPGCKADKAAKEFNDSIASVDGTTIEMDNATSYSDGWFSGGILEYDNDSRFIVSHSGDTLKISRPLVSLSAGDTVALYPGCDRTIATCRDKFNNLDNNLSFPYIPGKNPFQVSIKY